MRPATAKHNGANIRKQIQETVIQILLKSKHFALSIKKIGSN